MKVPARRVVGRTSSRCENRGASASCRQIPIRSTATACTQQQRLEKVRAHVTRSEGPRPSVNLQKIDLGPVRESLVTCLGRLTVRSCMIGKRIGRPLALRSNVGVKHRGFIVKEIHHFQMMDYERCALRAISKLPN